MAEVTCWTLIEGAALGDGAARTEFATRYLPVVRDYLRARWKNRLSEDALEDTVQEVFVECLKGNGVLERAGAGQRTSFRAYLLGAVRNIAKRAEVDLARRIDLPGSVTFDGEGQELEEATLTRVFDRAWAASILREAAARQAENARANGPESVRRVTLLRLVFEEERGLADIARQWNVDRNVLYREYKRAHDEFLDALKDVVTFHHPNAPDAVVRECRELYALFS